MPFKRKSESAATPSKRARSSLSATSAAAQETPSAGSPQTGDKRKRGRPRKNPEDLTPKKPETDGPKRGRGRPKKILTAAQVAAAEAAAATAGPKKGRGRPRKEPGSKITPVKPKTKDGRGRPRKSLPANGESEAKSSIFDAKSDENDESMPDVPEDNSGRSYWLMKAEPESRMEKGVDVKFSIDDLAAADKPEPWDGVRNPVARNLMRDMKKGDYAFFYHSNCKTPAVVGVMEIVQEHSPDEAAFDPKHPYYDPKSDRNDPKWVAVGVEFRRKFAKEVTLHDLKAEAQAGKPLENLQMIKQSRLSVSSVTPAQWRYIHKLAGEDPEAEFEPKVEAEQDQNKDAEEDPEADADAEAESEQDKDAEAEQDSELEL